MTDVPKLLSAELAFELLSGSELSHAQVCRRVLAIDRVSEGLAEHLARTLLGPDPRFRELPGGMWALAQEPCAGSVLLDRAAFVVVDVETTGMSPPADRVIEIGCVRIIDGKLVDEFATLINPRRPIPGIISSLTGITGPMVDGSPVFEEVAEEFLAFLGQAVFVAHNAPFDWRFVQSEVALATGRKLLNQKLCTVRMARRLVPELTHRSLDELACFWNLSFDQRHRALSDARVTAEILLRLVERAREKEIHSLDRLIDFLRPIKRPKTQDFHG